MRSIFNVPPNGFLLARANRNLWSPFGNAQIIKAIQENYIKKVYAVDRYYANYLIVQEICVFVYGEEMTRPEKIERRIKDERIKEKMDTFWDKKKKKKKNDDKPWYSPFSLWGN